MFRKVYLAAICSSYGISVCLSSAAIAFSVAGVTYLIWKKFNTNSQDNAITRIRIVSNADECEDAVNEIKKSCEKYRAVGFDCEWVTIEGRRRPISLLQISTCDGFCVLFRLLTFGKCPSSLKQLLEDPSVYKVGVAPIDDARLLRDDYDVKLKSTLDLRYMAIMSGYPPGGLAFLAKNHLGMVLDKNWRIRCSDWEAQELSERQVQYAANDAFVAIRIFSIFMSEQVGGRFWSKFASQERVDHVWNNLDVVCNEYIDVAFRGKQGAQKTNTAKALKVLAARKYPQEATRTKPLYHNCYLQAPDGELLCTCDTKKAMWYAEKGLADVMSESPLTIRLRFEPTGRSVGDAGSYYKLSKENRCVVCGATQSYIRKNVVPREYRKHFPNVMKEHSSHDVVLLCSGCHRRSTALDQPLRLRLQEQCRAPIRAAPDHDKFIQDTDLKKLRCAARALLYQSKQHRLPEQRRRELERVVLAHYPQHTALTDALLVEASEVRCVIENKSYESHSERVVDWYNHSEGGLLSLERLWREHFLSSMRPQYMPPLWSLDHNRERLMVRLQEGRLSESDQKILGLNTSL